MVAKINKLVPFGHW